MLRNKYSKWIVLAVIAIAIIIIVFAVRGSGQAKIPNTYNYSDLSTYITLGDYEGLEYSKDVEKVTKADIQSVIDSLIDDASGEQDVTSGKVTKNDKIKIDFVGKIDGEEFTGGTAENYTLDIPNMTMIDGFSEGIIGHKVGDTFDLNLTFPDDYSEEDVAGKDVVFTITVNAIVKDVVPEYNDEFVAANTEYKTTKEYEASVREELEADNEATADSAARADVFSQILESSEIVEYPETELEAAKSDMKSTYEEYAAQYDMEYADFLEQFLGSTEEDFEEEITSYAENTVKQQLVLRALANQLDINISKSEYNEYLESLLAENGLDKDTFETSMGSSLADYAEENNLFDSMLYEKVMDKVMELSKEKK